VGRTYSNLAGRDRDGTRFSVPVVFRGKTMYCLLKDEPAVMTVLARIKQMDRKTIPDAWMKILTECLSKKQIKGTELKGPCL
jgi:hypothetical protein